MNHILLVNKPQGISSFDVIFKLRKILKTKRLGHTGTLDPMATGLMVILVDKACKYANFIKNENKQYIAEIVYGFHTDSDDVTGKIIQETSDIYPINYSEIIPYFIGEIEQIPPKVSAIKINGKKLYQYARENKDVEIPKRTVTIYQIEEIGKDRLKIDCSKGTYIRTLVKDIGLKTNNLTCLKSLIRTKIANFSLSDAYSLDEIARGEFKFLDASLLLDGYQKFYLSDPSPVYHGKRLEFDSQEDKILLCDSQGNELAIYQRENGKVYKSLRGLFG